MSFTGNRIMLAGLVEIALPDATIRLSDGGFVYFGGHKFAAEDATFGAIETIESIEETSGDNAPGGSMTLIPKSAAAAVELSDPTFQGSRIRFWLVQVDYETGLADDGSAEMIADMLLDTTKIRFGKGWRKLEIGMVSVADRLFNLNEGNVLSSRFHQSVWPGELGLDNAVDVGTTVAWRVNAPPRGSVSGSGGGGGGGGRFEVNEAFR